MTNKQRRFIEEYMIDLNATQAAIRSGYSPRTAREIGAENLTKPVIADAVAKRLAELSRGTGITLERITRALAKLAFADTDVANNDKIKALKILLDYMRETTPEPRKTIDIQARLVEMEKLMEIDRMGV
jgi:phage terminase small subunit